MGNRAVIIPRIAFEEYDAAVGLYVHWYDESELNSWLDRLREEGYRPFSSDPCYALARLCQIACEEYIDGLNIGIMAVDPSASPSDYGLDAGFVIVDDYEVVETIRG